MKFEQLLDWMDGHYGDQRPIRLFILSRINSLQHRLIVKRVDGTETVCGSIEYRITCISNTPGLPLSDFIAAPAELQLVTDRGDRTSVCGIIDTAAEGDCDGGFATYQLTLRDALSIMEKRTNTRVFLRKNALDVTDILVREWRNSNPVLGKCFRLKLLCPLDSHPVSEFIMQHNETDAAFLRRLWKRRGIAWKFCPTDRSVDDDTPSHTLVLFDDSRTLPENSASTIRYHRPGSSEERDCIRSWTAVARLKTGVINRATWLLSSKLLFRTSRFSHNDHGPFERELSATLDDHFIDTPLSEIDPSDYHRLGSIRLLRHDYERNCFLAESDIRELKVGEWNTVTDHFELDKRPSAERQFIVTGLSIEAENNLPTDSDTHINRIFDSPGASQSLGNTFSSRDMRYRNTFTCVRRETTIIPGYDPTQDLPVVHPTVATIVCGDGQEIDTNEFGWVRIRIPGCRIEDHEHADGAGSSDSAKDSAWVPVATPWASQGYGMKGSFRNGDTVLLSFLHGDPDRPIVVGAIHSHVMPPPAFSDLGSMPGNQALAGIKSRELHGSRHNQLRLDDTPSQISAQLASQHGHSELNLGFLTHPRKDGFGKARGEGAELRTDQSVALRGACGVLISATARNCSVGGQLDREQLVANSDSFAQVHQELDRLSDAHHGDAADLTPMETVVRSLKTWHDGTNVAADMPLEAAHRPLVAIEAPAGLVAGSGSSILLGAQTTVDIVSVRNTQISAGHKLLMRAMKGLSLFAHTLGVKLIAASGKVQIESHRDDIEITSAKRIVLSASEEIVIQAPKLKLVSKGVTTAYDNGNLTHDMTGTFTVRSSLVEFPCPGGDATPRVSLPQSGSAHTQCVIVTDLNTGSPLPNRRYRVTLEDGNVIEGTTDNDGRTEVFESSIPFGSFCIELLESEES